MAEKGLAVIGLLWTEKGLENPYAFFYGFFIIFLWILFCVFIVVLIPPIRTSRELLSTKVIPKTLDDAVTYLEQYIAKQSPAEQDKNNMNRNNMDHLVQNWAGDDLATGTVFEQRIFKAPFQSLVPPLEQLANNVDRLLLRLIVLSSDTSSQSETDITIMQQASAILKACAKALSSSNDEALQDIQAFQKTCNNDGAKADPILDSAALYIYEQCMSIMEDTIAWLEALLHPPKPASFQEGFKGAVKVYATWLVVPFLPLLNLFSTYKWAAKNPKTWDVPRILWSLELVLGYIILFIMTVYWDDYVNFQLLPNDEFTGGLFQGWNMFAFAYAFMPTTEGTAKKGILRLIGTIGGGFLGWLGVIVCSWSYDDDMAEIDPYGMVVWLLVTTMVVAHYSIDSGLAAWSGSSYDHGTWGKYFVATQALIFFDTKAGPHTRDEITVNRIVANCSGVVIAIAVALLPPFYKGTDPRFSVAYFMDLKRAALETFEMCLNKDRSPEALSRRKETQKLRMSKVEESRKLQEFLLKDASTMRNLPFFQPNKNLKLVMDHMKVTESMIGRFSDYVLSIDADLANKSLMGIEAVTISLGGNSQSVQTTDDWEEGSTNKTLILLARSIRDRLNQHEHELFVGAVDSTELLEPVEIMA